MYAVIVQQDQNLQDYRYTFNQGKKKLTPTIKSSTFCIGFRGISQLGSDFIFLRWFKLPCICIQVTSLHKWKKQGTNHRFLIGNIFHVTQSSYSNRMFYLIKMIGLTMRSVTWNRFPIKNLWLIPCFFHLWSEVTWTPTPISVFFEVCMTWSQVKCFLNGLIPRLIFSNGLIPRLKIKVNETRYEMTVSAELRLRLVVITTTRTCARRKVSQFLCIH